MCGGRGAVCPQPGYRDQKQKAGHVEAPAALWLPSGAGRPWGKRALQWGTCFHPAYGPDGLEDGTVPQVRCRACLRASPLGLFLVLPFHLLVLPVPLAWRDTVVLERHRGRLQSDLAAPWPGCSCSQASSGASELEHPRCC